MNKKKQFFADIGLLFVAMIWGSAFVFSKYAVMAMEPMALMAVRFSCAALISVLFFHKKLFHLKKGELKAGIIIGFFLFTAYAFQMSGLQYIGAGRQAFETGIYVILVPFGCWLIFRDKPDKWNFFAAFLMLIGMGFLTLTPDEGLNLNQGDMLTIICAFLFTAQIIANGKYARDYDPVTLTMIQLITAAVFSDICCLFMRTSFTGISAIGWFSALYCGLFSTFICALLQTICQKYTTDTHAAILMCMETVFGSIASYFFLQEYFTMQTIIGFVIIFVAIIISETKLSFLFGKTNEKGR